jgi:hypothetical protein
MVSYKLKFFSVVKFFCVEQIFFWQSFFYDELKIPEMNILFTQFKEFTVRANHHRMS